MPQITDYGKSIKHRLIDIDKSQKWLIEEVQKRTGLYFDTSYMGKIMVGKEKNRKIITAINEILGLDEAAPDSA